MAYDTGLAQRIREEIGDHPTLIEKEMFGGVGFMVEGNMACGVIKEDLIVRVGPEQYNDALEKPHTRPFDFTGRPMKGWVMVTSDGYDSDESLTSWVQQGLAFARSLPAK